MTPKFWIKNILNHTSYIAGDKDGIVTRAGKPAALMIYVFDAKDLTLINRTASLANGHYLIRNLNPDTKYLIMARDHGSDYEPCVFDQVVPANDLSIEEQMTLWESFKHG